MHFHFLNGVFDRIELKVRKFTEKDEKQKNNDGTPIFGSIFIGTLRLTYDKADKNRSIITLEILCAFFSCEIECPSTNTRGLYSRKSEEKLLSLVKATATIINHFFWLEYRSLTMKIYLIEITDFSLSKKLLHSPSSLCLNLFCIQMTIRLKSKAMRKRKSNSKNEINKNWEWKQKWMNEYRTLSTNDLLADGRKLHRRMNDNNVMLCHAKEENEKKTERERNENESKKKKKKIEYQPRHVYTQTPHLIISCLVGFPPFQKEQIHERFCQQNRNKREFHRCFSTTKLHQFLRNNNRERYSRKI